MIDHSALIDRLEARASEYHCADAELDRKVAAALRDLTEWRDIATAPKDGTEVFAWDGSDNIICHWHGSVAGWVTDWETVSGYDVGWNKVSPTHWLPLPSTPNQAKEAGE